jgi:hypothetical protein
MARQVELRLEVFKGRNIFRSDPDPGLSSEAGSISRSIPTWILEPNHNPVREYYNCPLAPPLSRFVLDIPAILTLYPFSFID